MKALRLAAAAIWMTAGAAGCGMPDNLTIVIFDFAGVRIQDLVSAGREAHRVFAVAGIETTWVVCQVHRDPRQHCALPPAGAYAQVKILPPVLEGKLQSPEGLGYATKCSPSEGCGTSYLFYRPALALAESAGRPVAVLLGYVMAHEIGHLMGMGHSPQGIMKAQFDHRDVQDASAGRVRFLGDEAKRLRAAVALWMEVTTGEHE